VDVDAGWIKPPNSYFCVLLDPFCGLETSSYPRKSASIRGSFPFLKTVAQIHFNRFTPVLA
jgi:hypothetical protein